MMHSEKYQLTHVVPLARHRAQNGVRSKTRARILWEVSNFSKIKRQQNITICSTSIENNNINEYQQYPLIIPTLCVAHHALKTKNTERFKTRNTDSAKH